MSQGEFTICYIDLNNIFYWEEKMKLHLAHRLTKLQCLDFSERFLWNLHLDIQF